jgi:hypothetical protein
VVGSYAGIVPIRVHDCFGGCFKAGRELRQHKNAYFRMRTDISLLDGVGVAHHSKSDKLIS